MRPSSFAVLLFMLSALILASPETISVPVSTVNELITVNSSLDFTSILPGYEHNGTITVSWNIPAQSIASVKAGEVPVHVLLSTDEENSIYFRQAGANSKEARLRLVCIARNGSCAEGSNLSASVEVVALATEKQDANATIEVNASLSPLWQESELMVPPSAADALANASGTLKELADAGGALLNGSANLTQNISKESAAGQQGGAPDLVASLRQNIVPLVALALIALVVAAAYLLRKRKYN